jgi:hypothetical protein
MRGLIFILIVFFGLAFNNQLFAQYHQSKKIDKWNPEELMELYIEMGARYFMAMDTHHDNFDCYDSQVDLGVNMGLGFLAPQLSVSHSKLCVK